MCFVLQRCTITKQGFHLKKSWRIEIANDSLTNLQIIHIGSTAIPISELHLLFKSVVPASFLMKANFAVTCWSTVTSVSVTQPGLRWMKSSVLIVNHQMKWRAEVADSPRLPRHCEGDDVTAVKNGDNDQKHQEQEADEEHNSLNRHSCQKKTERGHFLNIYQKALKLSCR